MTLAGLPEALRTLKLVEQLTTKGVHLVSVSDAIDTNTPTGKLMLTMIGAINEFERTNLLERQREGITIAKREGSIKAESLPRCRVLRALPGV